MTLARVAGAIGLSRFVAAYRKGGTGLRRRFPPPRARLERYDLAAAMLFGTLLVLVAFTFSRLRDLQR